jgi:hypothetical protein
VAVDKQSEFETKFLCFPPESVTVLINWQMLIGIIHGFVMLREEPDFQE